MSGQVTAITLKEIILGISESLNDAQHQLRSTAPYDEYGRPNVLYTLPHLDFDIKVEIEAKSNSESIPQSSQKVFQRKNMIGNRPVSKAIMNPTLLMKPVKISNSSTNSSKITSSISGRFVAVAPNQGLPQMSLSHTIESINNIYTLTVLVANSAGDKIPGAKVEINFVEEESDALNVIPILGEAEIHTSNSEGVTFGTAKTTITVDNNDIGKNIVFEINVGLISKFISI